MVAGATPHVTLMVDEESPFIGSSPPLKALLCNAIIVELHHFDITWFHNSFLRAVPCGEQRFEQIGKIRSVAFSPQRVEGFAVRGGFQ